MLRPTRLFPLHLSAASGLVRLGRHVLVAADDEHFLDVYELTTGHRQRLLLPFAGELPEAPAERKRRKPDLESLVSLPDGRVLALGSGSTSARERGVLVEVALGSECSLRSARLIDLAPLCAVLRRELPELNLEGAAVSGPLLRLFQRGNGAVSQNAVIDLDLSATLRALDTGEPLSGALVRQIHSVDLGELQGVPLAFTDACAPPGSSTIVFAAAAEDSASTYEDGACVGSVLGQLDASGRVLRTVALEGHWKIEGVAPGERGLLLVNDPDARAVPADLLQVDAPFS